MGRKSAHTELLLISKSPKNQLDYMAAGAGLVERTGKAIPALVYRAAQDRIKLSRTFLRDAKAAKKASPSLNRTAVSRAYYSLYHAMRAAVFCSYGGDDNEQHTRLPSAIPTDFPDRLQWENTLKIARLERNKADYDPYPSKSEEFSSVALQLIDDAEKLLAVAPAYIAKFDPEK